MHQIKDRWKTNHKHDSHPSEKRRGYPREKTPKIIMQNDNSEGIPNNSIQEMHMALKHMKSD